jgi:hypothetical protein
MRIYLSDNVFIEQCSAAPFLWDLYTVSKGIRKGKEELVEWFKASGLDLGQVLKKAPDFELNEKYKLNEEEFLNLKDYVEEFKKIQEEMFQKIKITLKNKDHAI